tara:strand:- start:198 stop:620 length:423 start_codon:yes stop_codon:yes gene_type:complete
MGKGKPKLKTTDTILKSGAVINSKGVEIHPKGTFMSTSNPKFNLKKNNTSKSNGTATTTATKKKGLAKFVTDHEKTLTALEKIGEGASALDPLTDSGNRPASTGSALGDKGADFNPYTVVRGGSDVLTKKERKKLDSYTA